MTGPSRWSIRNWTLRRRVGRWFLLLVCLLVLAFATLLGAVLNFAGKGNELINRWQPAGALSSNVLADLVNQETGLRGYVIGRREVFLEPYVVYTARQRADEARLRSLLHGHRDLLSALATVDARAGEWRSQVADPYISRARRNDPTLSAQAVNSDSKAGLDRIRAASAALTGRLGAEQRAARAARATALVLALVATGVAAALTLGSKFLLWRGLRSQVLEPVEALAAQTRAVAAGAIDQKIVEGGPPEIAALGRDVDSMRAQIASELARVELARQVLVQRGEDLARSNADLEQFAYVASHDLSEPLRKVANFCQLLERQYAPQLDDKARQYIAFAVDGAKRMQVLISDLLSFSRVGRTTDGFEPVDTGAALDSAVAHLDDRIAASGAEIVRDGLPTVDGDPTLITALFQNLVGNALKYSSPDRPPRVEIRAERDGELWQFTVTDNGIGIDPQYAERIFTIFQRLHLRDRYGGTGIGLALCRKIVEFHRGRIWLVQQEGGPGATFQFTIPERAVAPDDLIDELTAQGGRDEHRTDGRAGPTAQRAARGGRSG